MFLGKNMKNNQIFSKEEHIEKNLNDLPTKQWIEKKRKFYFNYLIII